MIAVVAYGAGNLRSVANALDHLAIAYEITSDAGILSEADKILLPGVGHFGPMMKRLETTGLAEAIRTLAIAGKPLLGICLGMQALFETSDEAPGVAGLGLLRGHVRRFAVDLPVPQIGWNEVSHGCHRDWYYFANSLYVPVGPVTEAVAEYGTQFSASVKDGLIRGFQFHPEKSGSAGLELLRRWCEVGE